MSIPPSRFNRIPGIIFRQESAECRRQRRGGVPWWLLGLGVGFIVVGFLFILLTH